MDDLRPRLEEALAGWDALKREPGADGRSGTSDRIARLNAAKG